MQDEAVLGGPAAKELRQAPARLVPLRVRHVPGGEVVQVKPVPADGGGGGGGRGLGGACSARHFRFRGDPCPWVTGPHSPPAPTAPSGGRAPGQKRGGGSGIHKLVYQKQPKSVFPVVNFIFSHDKTRVPGWGGLSSDGDPPF